MDRKVGPWRLRLWGLIANLVGNVLALFGVVRVVRGGSPALLWVGGAITVACVAALALPSRGEHPGGGRREGR